MGYIRLFQPLGSMANSFKNVLIACCSLITNKYDIMRELTKNEKRLVTAIVTKCVPNSTVNIGKILKEIYNIYFMQKYSPSSDEEKYISESDYSSVIFHYTTCKERNFQAEINEAILLLLLLKKEGYIFMNYSSFISNKSEIGEKHEMLNSMQDNFRDEKIQIFDRYSGTNLWELLNSNCIVTNSLRDYAKDFKTEEQRRFRTSIRYTWIAIVISLISCKH